MKASRIFAPIIALTMGFVLTISGSAAASPASSTPVAEPDVCETVAVSNLAGNEVSSEADELVAVIESGDFTIHATEAALDMSAAEVFAIESDAGTHTAGIVPIGDGYSLTSNFTVLFDASGDVVQYSETLVSENDAGNFNVTTYFDGQLASSQDTSLSYMTDAELEREMNDPTPVEYTQNTAACIATVLGVSGVTAALIAYACAGACAAAAAGVGVPFCVACIAAYATIGGASITAVASCF